MREMREGRHTLTAGKVSITMTHFDNYILPDQTETLSIARMATCKSERWLTEYLQSKLLTFCVSCGKI